MDLFARLRNWRFRTAYLLKSLVLGALGMMWRRWFGGRGSWVRVFIASTYADLRRERFALEHELSRSYHVVTMEKHRIARETEKQARGLVPGSSEERRDDEEYALRWSREHVAAADMVIFLLGSRYGYRPWQGSGPLMGEDLSITLLEAGWAYEHRKPILVYRIKQPLDDEEAFRSRMAYAESWAYPEQKPDDRRTDPDDDDDQGALARVTQPVAMYLGFARIHEIASGEQLIRTVPRDVDRMTARLKLVSRLVLLVIWACVGFGAWWIWNRVGQTE